MAEKLRNWIIRRLGGYTREETAKKYAIPKAMRDVLSGKAPGACTSVEFLEVDFPTECTEQPEKEDAPTVDAVPVVRCWDCKHFSAHYNPYFGRILQECNYDDPKMVAPEDFCSYGERKEAREDVHKD